MAGSNPGSPAPPSALTPGKRRRVAAAATAAAVVEWYDFFAFAIASALVFGPVFFPSTDPVTGVLASFATFFVGFAARPLGGILAGQWGDRIGRKPVLVAALLLMGVATLFVGVLPTYATVGVLAPIALVVLRVLQGIAVGAMWGGALLLATEYAPEGKRGLYGSLVSSAVGIATVLANGTFLLVSWLAPGAAFAAWGWRIPFAVGVLVLLLAWYIHRTVEETPEYRQAGAGTAESRRPLRTVLRKHGGTVALAAASFLLLQSFFYIQVTGLLDYTTRVLHMSRQSVLTVVLIGMTFVAILTPAFASLSDRIGRLKVYVIGAVAVGVWAFPYFLLVDTANMLLVGTAVVVGAIFASILGAPQPALFAELFEPAIRYTGSSVAYQASSLIGGGLTPFVMVLLIGSTGTALSISVMLGLLAVLTVVSVALLRHRVAAGTTTPAVEVAAEPVEP